MSGKNSIRHTLTAAKMIAAVLVLRNETQGTFNITYKDRKIAVSWTIGHVQREPN